MASRLSRASALRAYVGLELGVAVAALLLPWELRLLTPALSWAYGDGGAGLLFPLMRLVSCLLMVFAPAAALGATFPMAIRWFASEGPAPARMSGMLYALNTAGAAVGAMLAGFILIPAVGVSGTTYIGVAASLIAALAVYLVIRRRRRPRQPASRHAAVSIVPGGRPDRPSDARRPSSRTARETSLATLGLARRCEVAGRGRVGTLWLRVADARDRLDAHPGARAGSHHLCVRGHARGGDRRRRHRIRGGIVDGEPRPPARGVAGHRARPGGDDHQLHLFAGRTADPFDRRRADGERRRTLCAVAAPRLVADRRPDPAHCDLPRRGISPRAGIERRRRRRRCRPFRCGLCRQHDRRRVRLTRGRVSLHPALRSPGHAAGGERLPDRRGSDRGPAQRADRRRSCGGTGGRARRRGAAGHQSCVGSRTAGQRTVHVRAVRAEGSRPRPPSSRPGRCSITARARRPRSR